MPALSDQGQIIDLTDVVYEGRRADPAALDLTFQLTLSGAMMMMSMEDHPMHLHGHTSQVVGINGRSVDGPLKDTLTLRHMEQYDIEFVANNPGTWLFHCHNLVHMRGGLMAQVRYS